MLSDHEYSTETEEEDIEVYKFDLNLLPEREYPLHDAIASKDYNQIRNLMEQHAFDIRMNETVIHAAAHVGEWRLIKQFMKLGVKINTKSFDNETPLDVAIANNHPRFMMELIECGVPLGEYFPYYFNVNDLKFLVKHGMPVDIRNSKDDTILHVAARYEDEESVQYLVDLIDVNSKCIYGWTPLTEAIEKSNAKIVKLLLPKANLYIRDNEGLTIISKALKFNDKDVIRELLKSPTLREKDRTRLTKFQ